MSLFSFTLTLVVCRRLASETTDRFNPSMNRVSPASNCWQIAGDSVHGVMTPERHRFCGGVLMLEFRYAGDN